MINSKQVIVIVSLMCLITIILYFNGILIPRNGDIQEIQKQKQGQAHVCDCEQHKAMMEHYSKSIEKVLENDKWWSGHSSNLIEEINTNAIKIYCPLKPVYWRKPLNHSVDWELQGRDSCQHIFNIY